MSTLAQAQTVIEGPATPGRGLVRRETLPSEFTSLGIAAFRDDAGSMTLKIPPSLRKVANVLDPVEVIQQADPNWLPSLRVVQLDPSKDGPHFYPQAGGKLAPRKQGLELLADAAGVVAVRTTLGGRERVVVGDLTAETFTHVAVLKIRKSDGTLRTLEASRTYEPFAEFEEVRDAVTNADEWKNNQRTGRKRWIEGTPEFASEVRKRWLNEIKFAKAKNESKAILRAIRSALQIGHTFTPAEAAKPFVVFGWNLSPQDTPEVRAAIAQLYGAAPEHAVEVHQDWGGYELEEPPLEVDASEASGQEEVPVAPTPPGAAEPSGSHDSPEDAPASPGGADGPAGREPGEQEPGSANGPAPAPSLLEPAIPGLEADADIGPVGLTEAELAEVSAFGKTKPPFGTYQNQTIAKVFAIGEAADPWIAHALRLPVSARDREFHRLLVLACRVHRPALFEAWQAEVLA